MGEISINSFNKGILNDQGELIPADGTYIDAKNVRIVANDSEGESGVLVNVKGNTHSFNLSFDCATCKTTFESQGSVEYQNGITLEAYQFIQYNDAIYYTIENVTFNSEEDVQQAILNNTFRRCVQEDIDFLISNGFIETSGCPAIPIGHAAIRDTLYIYTASLESPGSGAIFKIDFNLQTDQAEEPELLYFHPELNFSTEYPIEALGRYETDNVQRLYWTDNNNPVRTINVALPNISDLTPEDLDINPSTTFSKPEILEVISSGDLPSGMYQYAYRLRSKSGSETRFSPFTGFLHIVEASESGAPYWTYTEDPEDISQYEGSTPGVTCQKSVKIQVENIDTTYDTIEFAAIYKSTQEGVSSTYIFKRQAVTGTTIETIHSSNTEIVTLVSLTEVTSFNYNIKKAKTLTSKDNRLFLGNVETPLEELKFNARAYRYRRTDNIQHSITAPESTETYVSNVDFNPNDYNPDDYTEEELQELLDAINPYNDSMLSVNRIEDMYKYQDNGLVLGGTGPNVSYRFIKKELSGDTFVAGETAVEPPFIETIPITTQDCGVGVDWLDYKNPLAVEKYKGYQRDEIYRFGVVLYDKQGNPGFVNWVGDIRFPRYKDIDVNKDADLINYTLSQTRSTADANGKEYFASGSQSGASYESLLGPEGAVDGNYESALETGQGKRLDIDRHSLYALGIEFEVNVPEEMHDKVSGFSIVRVKRNEIDKSVAGIGMGAYLYGFADESRDDDSETWQLAHSGYMATWAHNNGDISERYDHGRLHNNKLTMDSPDFVFKNKYPSAGSCDWVEVIGNLTNGASRNAWENHFRFGGVTTGTDDDYYRKMYSHQVLYIDNINNPVDWIYMQGFPNSGPNIADGAFFRPKEARKFGSGASLPKEDFPKGLNNIAVEVNGETSQDTYSIGCDTLYIQFESAGNVGGQDVDYIAEDVVNLNTACKFPYWSYWIQPGLVNENPTGGSNAGMGGEFDGNRIYFNKGDIGESNIESSYFNNSDPLDVCLCGTASASDRYDVPYQRHRVQEKLLLAWRRDIFDIQYGGKSFEDRSRNVYINANNFTPLDQTNLVQVYGGDTFVQFYDFQKLRKWNGGQSPDDNFTNNTSGPTVRHNFCFAIPVESTINTGLRQGYHFAGKDTETGFTGLESDNKQLDQYEYDDVYSAENDLLQFYPEPYNYVEIDQYDSRVLYSDIKVNGDPIDAWRQFRINNYRDVEGEHGGINKIVNYADNIFYLQDRGVGLLSINPVALATTTDDSNIVLGTGKVIQDHKYISTNIGCKHQRSVLATNRGLYWVDILNNAAYKIDRQSGTLELSRIKGIKNYFEKKLEGSVYSVLDNAFYHSGITTGFDARTNEVLFSFLERGAGSGRQGLIIVDQETLVYNETTGTFTSKYTFASPMFIDMQDKLLSVRPWTTNDNNEILNSNEIWLHNNLETIVSPRGSWYGNVGDSSVSFIANRVGSETKVFDNLEIYSKLVDVGNEEEYNSSFSSLFCETSYQANGFDLIPEETIIRRERTWKTAVPRDQGVRMRDKYLKTTLTYDNNQGGKLKTHYVITKFRVSKR